MAKQRVYSDEYKARVARAKEHGFKSYAGERQYRSVNASELQASGSSVYWKRVHRGDWRKANPRQLMAFYTEVILPAEDFIEGERNGQIRRLAVLYFQRWEDYEKDDSVEQMRLLYGETP